MSGAAEAGQHGVGMGDHGARVDEELFPFGSQADAAGRAFDEAASEHLFQFADLLGHGGLRPADKRAGAREISRLGQKDEGAENGGVDIMHGSIHLSGR